MKTCRGEHNRIVATFVEFPQPGVHVSAHWLNVYIRTSQRKLSSSPQRARADRAS
jgi:hypothetical protein